MPPGHPPIQFLRRLPKCEVLVVGFDDEQGLHPDEVSPPVLQGLDDS